MNTTHRLRPQQGARERLAQGNCYVPPADGVQAVDLRATSQAMVERGAEQAGLWLDSVDSLPLPDALERLRLIAPTSHWEALEAGFLARIDQRLRSDIGGQHRSTEQREGLLAIGDSYMAALHQQVSLVVELVRVGAIVPNSSSGAYQLSALASMAKSAQVLGRVTI